MASGQGIAIKTSFLRFKASFMSPRPDVLAGMVRFVVESFEVESSNIFNSGII